MVTSSSHMESFADALAEVVKALGGAKNVGAALKPSRPVEDTARWVRDCLNPDRRERFDPDEVLWLMREARRVGFHGAMHFVTEFAGYARPTPLEPLDEIAELQRNFIESVRLQKLLVDRLAQLEGATGTPLRAVA